MKRPQIALPRRPRTTAGVVARTRKEAAIQLVRLEFDAARLEFGAAQAQARVSSHNAELQTLSSKREKLLEQLKRS